MAACKKILSWVRIKNDSGSVRIVKEGEKINQNHILWIKSLLDNLKEWTVDSAFDRIECIYSHVSLFSRVIH